MPAVPSRRKAAQATPSVAGPLTLLLPLSAWAKQVAARCAQAERPLSPWQLAEAVNAGVVAPERVRLCISDILPRPADAHLEAAAIETGLISPGVIAMTLGYTVLICRSQIGRRGLLRERFCNLALQERAGGLQAYLAQALRQPPRFPPNPPAPRQLR
jgi:hypothetical protein